MNNLKKDNVEKGNLRNDKGNIWKRTVPKRKNYAKGQFRKGTNLKKDNSETDLDGQHGPVNKVWSAGSGQQVWSTRSGQPGPVNQVRSTRSKSGPGGVGRSSYIPGCAR